MLSTRGLPTRFAAAIIVLMTGCVPAPNAAPDNSPPSAPTGATQPAAASSQSPRETWDVITIQGTRAGYVHTTITRLDHQGRPAVRVDGVNHLVLTRAGEKSSQQIRFTSFETTDGKLIEFQTTTEFGQVPVETTGRVEGDLLLLQTKSLGRTDNTSMPWKAEFGGPYAVELSLERQPLQPGQTRVIRSLFPGLNKIVTTTLTARQYESVPLATGTYELLHIDTQSDFPDGTRLPGVVWADRTGQILKNFSQLLSLETVRATKAQALDQRAVGGYDLMTNLSVRLARPMTLGHNSHRARYRVTVDGHDPAALLVSCPSQQVKSLDPHTAEVTVVALRPAGNPAALSPSEIRDHADDLSPNSQIQSDAPVIVEMAKQAAAGQKDPWPLALALERYVQQNITRKTYSQAFATAAEVARSRAGDCTEHSLLLAALARACGIPARVAVGLVYVEANSTFAYHMWCELFIGGQWIPMDATLARGGIGAAHLKLAHSNLKGGDAFSSFLPVLNLMGRLKIDVLEEQ